MSRNRISKEGRLQDYHHEVGSIWRSRNQELEQEVFDKQPPWMDPEEEDIDTQIDLKRLIPEVLETLTNRERKLLWCRFWADLTLDETAIVFDVTRERIRQIEKHAILRLKHPSRSDLLRPYRDVFLYFERKQEEWQEAKRKANQEFLDQYYEDKLLKKLLQLRDT
jgi:DNA-directed RNA polymerase specialized sigma24 family protein